MDTATLDLTAGPHRAAWLGAGADHRPVERDAAGALRRAAASADTVALATARQQSAHDRPHADFGPAGT